MLLLFMIVLLAAAVLYGSYRGYRQFFYYQDPLRTPYQYTKTDQTEACRERLEQTIAEFEAVPCEDVTILSHDGLTLAARYYHVADGGPLEIQFHGYKGNATRDFCGFWQIARDAGRNVLLVDQRSHRKSQGHTITFGIRERLDCLSWVRYACERFRDVPIFLSGVSMGAGTVLMASGLELPENVKGVMADCPFNSPRNILRKLKPGGPELPAALTYPLVRLGALLFGRFDPEADSPLEAVRRSRIPILVIHGDADQLVPHEMGRSLQSAAPETVEFHTIHGAGHALDYITAPEMYRQIVNTFTAKCLR